jgi:hypothetical protein
MPVAHCVHNNHDNNTLRQSKSLMAVSKQRASLHLLQAYMHGMLLQAEVSMSLFLADELPFAEKAADLVTINPFDPAWVQKQRDLLGTEATDPDQVYAWKPGLAAVTDTSPNAFKPSSKSACGDGAGDIFFALIGVAWRRA